MSNKYLSQGMEQRAAGAASMPLAPFSMPLPASVAQRFIAGKRRTPNAFVMEPEADTLTDDQAATLRRLFTAASASVLPVLLPDDEHGVRLPWLAKLAQGFARQGSRTLIVDAARAHIALAFGLRARYDLHHALTGECSFDQAILDAGPGLAVLPAGRAAQSALAEGAAAQATGLGMSTQAMNGLNGLEAALRTCIARRPEFDLILLLVGVQAATLLPRGALRGDVLMPVEPNRSKLGHAITALERVGQLREPGEIGAFRLLFLGMEPTAAATLAHRMATKVNLPSEMLASAGAATVARDLSSVVLAASGWNLARIAAPDVESLA